MIHQIIAFLMLISIASTFVNAQNDEIYFPGPTQRPDRYPLHKPTTRSPPILNPNDPPVISNTDRPVTPTATTAPVQQSTPSLQAYNQCVNSCLATSEYNPVCGTDGVVYYNLGRLNCARYCGNPVEKVKYGQCIETIRG